MTEYEGYTLYIYEVDKKLETKKDGVVMHQWLPVSMEEIGIISYICAANSNDRYGSLWPEFTTFNPEGKVRYYFYESTWWTKFLNSPGYFKALTFIILGIILIEVFSWGIGILVTAGLYFLFSILKNKEMLYNKYQYRFCYYSPRDSNFVLVDDYEERIILIDIETVLPAEEVPDDNVDETMLVKLIPRDGVSIIKFEKNALLAMEARILEVGNRKLENRLIADKQLDNVLNERNGKSGGYSERIVGEVE